MGTESKAAANSPTAHQHKPPLMLSMARRCHRFMGMRSVGQVDKAPERVPASPEVADRAADLVRRFSECFWFRHPDAAIRFTDDVRLVIEHLRDYGDKRAWDAAAELQRCL